MLHTQCFPVRISFQNQTEILTYYTVQGQAGAQAIEDSAALAIMVSDLTKSKLQANPSLLSERLQLFQDVRMNRVSAMQIFSNSGQDQAAGVAEAVKSYFKDGEPLPTNPDEFNVYNFSHDVVKESLRTLREHQEKGVY